MERYFFHFSCKEAFVSDTKGRELEDLASAHRHAMLLIHKMIVLDDLDWKGWSVNVTDAGGRSVLAERAAGGVEAGRFGVRQLQIPD